MRGDHRRWGAGAWVMVAVGVTAASPLRAQTVQLLGYEAAVPVGWSARAASSRMRLAEFTTPAARDSIGAEVIVYFFGEGQGGSADANLARWKGQFSNPDGSPVTQNIERDSTGKFPTTFASYRGTYARGIGAGSAPEKGRPNSALVAAVVETPKGTLFFQLFGPIAVVESQRDAYIAFVRGLK